MLRYKRPPQFDTEEEELEVRPSPFIRVVAFLFVIAFLVLAYNLYQIQVVQGTSYKRAADENRIRQIRVDAARGVGTYVLAHAYGPRAIQNCLQAGVRSIEHANFLDEETADRMLAADDAYLVPTIITY